MVGEEECDFLDFQQVRLEILGSVIEKKKFSDE